MSPEDETTLNMHGKDHNKDPNELDQHQDRDQDKHPMQRPAQQAGGATDGTQDNRRHSPSVVDKFVIRLPQGLRDQIRELSEHNRRSMNSEIIMVLEQYIQQHASTASENQVDTDSGDERADPAASAGDSEQSGLSADAGDAGAGEGAGEESLDEKLKSLPPEKKAALLSLLT